MVNGPPRIGTIASSGRCTTVARRSAPRRRRRRRGGDASGSSARRTPQGYTAADHDARSRRWSAAAPDAAPRRTAARGAGRAGARRRARPVRRGRRLVLSPAPRRDRRHRRRPRRARRALVPGRRRLDRDRRPPALLAAARAAIVAAIRDARAAGLAVTLFPIVRLSAPRTRRRVARHARARAIAPPGGAATAPASSQLARLAAREHVAVLSVGSELSTLDGPADRAAWAAAVAEVRRVFHGALMYSGNWDHFRDVAVYDLVDVVGLCAYFALVEPGAAATVEDLTRGWRDWRVELERFFARAAARSSSPRSATARSTAPAPRRGTKPRPAPSISTSSAAATPPSAASGAAPARRASAASTSGTGTAGAAPTSRGYTPRGKPAARRAARLLPSLSGSGATGSCAAVARRIVRVDHQRVGLRRTPGGTNTSNDWQNATARRRSCPAA